MQSINVPREPILKSEKWRRFFSTLRADVSTHLCTTFGMAARNWNRTPKSWIRHWFVSVVIVSNAGRERNWIYRERNSIHMKLLRFKPWILHSQIRYSRHCIATGPTAEDYPQAMYSSIVWRSQPSFKWLSLSLSLSITDYQWTNCFIIVSSATSPQVRKNCS